MAEGPLAPVVLSIPYRDPLIAFAPLATVPMAVLLDSALPTAQGRYSYIAIDPVQTLELPAGSREVRVDGVSQSGDPFRILAQRLAAHCPASASAAGPAPFGGGAIGWFAYELGGAVERLPPARDRLVEHDMVVGIYPAVAAFDHHRAQAWVIAHGADANARATGLAARLGHAALSPERREPFAATWRAERDAAAHQAAVAAAIDLIRAGDIFQANITQRFFADAPTDLDWWALYRRLRARAAAPFAAFFHGPRGVHLLSASPERFLAVDRRGAVETRPIKGTRPRGTSPADDRALAADLRTSAKDHAENLMIVDLLRNDLGRVCEPGSVTVPVLLGLESFPAVHHLVSVVTGRLRRACSALDLLRACFPGGSVTGAPKIRAMEVIHALEAGARGPYCGALAWLGFDGAMDSSIVIRSIVGDARRIVAQAGGGIVAESNPAQEYAESLLKAAPLLAALSDAPPRPASAAA